MRIVVLDGYTLNPGDLDWTDLHRLGTVEVYERTSYNQIIERSSNADIVLTNKVPINAEIIDALPKLQYIGVMATGFNIVDVQYANSKGIVVSNAAGYSSASVVQTTFALMLALCIGPEAHSNWAKTNWSSHSDFSNTLFSLKELAGKTLGLIGYGNIAQNVAKVADAFGMKVIVNRHSNKSADKNTLESLEALASKSDFVSLHLPYSAGSAPIIDTQFILKMKKTAFLINTARGQLIDENALANALSKKTIAGAALDVLSKEPPEKNTPLLKCSNLILTPHIAWASIEARSRLMEIICENIRNYMMGEPTNVVS